MKTTAEITYNDIIHVICSGEKIHPDKVFQKTRKKEIVFARHLIMYFARKYNLGTLASVGSSCGGFDHATVLHAEKAINNYIDTEPRKAALIKKYDSLILQAEPDLQIENKQLKERIRLLEDEIFSLQSRLYQMQPKQSITVREYSGYREHAI